jgi:cytoplasmic iron level regulating protein YaaA (DUF328/UPF0246 family)
MEDRALILLSCSRDKRDAGSSWPQNAPTLIDGSVLPTQAQEIARVRKWIYHRLKGEEPLVYNSDHKGGLCHERWGNYKLKLGPDFQGHDAGGAYREAHDRYKGRFFTALDRELQGETGSFWNRIRNRELPLEILFVSGLYGLLLWDEPIQEYDCHFADYCLGSDPKTIKEIWGDVLTDVLVEFINRSGRSARGGKITRVYDLLSDSYYQSVFSWNRVSGINLVGSRVYHRIFADDAGADVLPKIATLLVRYLDRLCDSAAPKFNNWMTLTGATGSTFKFGFEREIGNNREAAREGLLLTERKVLDRDAWLSALPKKAFDQWILAEHALQQVQVEQQCDFGAIVVSFAKVVEGFFRPILNRETKRENASLNDIVSMLSTSKFNREPRASSLSRPHQGPRSFEHVSQRFGGFQIDAKDQCEFIKFRRQK